MSDGHDGHGKAADHSAKLTPVSVYGYKGLTREELLVMYGFVKKEHKSTYQEKIAIHSSEIARRREVKKLGKEKAKAMAASEHVEVVDEGFSETSFPGGSARFHLILETTNENLEDSYFEILEKARQQEGFPNVYKTSDYFAASENSAFFGNSQQRIGIQQDRVQQFLANIGKFVKELFQMVRELRILDERLAIYEAAGGLPKVEHDSRRKKTEHHGDEHHDDHGHDSHGHGGGHGHGHGPSTKLSPAADVTLKSIFTDLVEGGTKNPQSVFGLASQVNFTLLPDLFFNTYVEKPDQVDATVEAMNYNKSLKSVLKRKLYQYLVWKEKTYVELVHRRNFNLKYLRQHWTIINMYMAWVKPYLRNIERLTMRQQYMEEPDIIAGFETSFIEVEFVAFKEARNGYHPVVVCTFYFRTRPDMSARKEFQQGPVHMGRMDMNIRAYAWTKEEVDNYRLMKKREEIELLGLLDSSLSDIMEALGEEFEHYLKEAGEEMYKEEAVHAHTKQPGAMAPFISLFAGFKDIIEAFIPDRHEHHEHHGDPGAAYQIAAGSAGRIYHTYKKGKRMITW